tara:strand:- start:11 stop:184 length:174 start_codon:yes stop_codon:yes gene_type:complete
MERFSCSPEETIPDVYRVNIPEVSIGTYLVNSFKSAVGLPNTDGVYNPILLYTVADG